MRLIDSDKLTADILALRDCPNGNSDTYDKACIIGIIEEQPTVEAIPVEWIKKHIEEDRQNAEKAKAEEDVQLLHYYKTLELCVGCLLFDWEDENGKYEEFEGEIWQD